jgi:hypothetical protein
LFAVVARIFVPIQSKWWITSCPRYEVPSIPRHIRIIELLAGFDEKSSSSVDSRTIQVAVSTEEDRVDRRHQE